MGSPLQAASLQALGFLTIVREPAGYIGGYLVTNAWGRPLEFRLSSAVQPNRVQQVLYGPSLEPFLFGDLIGKTLIDKTATTVQLVITDQPAALNVRRSHGCPVALVQHDAEPPLAHHPDFPEDGAALEELLGKLSSFDFAEPFNRIREALVEARKLGVGANKLVA